MKVTASLESKFIPKFNGNHDLPSGEQISVEIKWPNMAQREQLKGFTIDQKGAISISFNMDRILRQHVGKITNLESEVNGKTFVIIDGKTLAEDTNPILDDLADEIKAEVTKRLELEEEEVKN